MMQKYSKKMNITVNLSSYFILRPGRHPEISVIPVLITGCSSLSVGMYPKPTIPILYPCASEKSGEAASDFFSDTAPRLYLFG